MGNSHPPGASEAKKELNGGLKSFLYWGWGGAGYFPSAASAGPAFVLPALEEETTNQTQPHWANREKEHAGEKTQQLERERWIKPTEHSLSKMELLEEIGRDTIREPRDLSAIQKEYLVERNLH